MSRDTDYAGGSLQRVCEGGDHVKMVRLEPFLDRFF